MVLAIRAGGRNARAAGKDLVPLVSAQFSGDISSVMTGGDEMTSSGAAGVEDVVGVLAHPAKSIAAPRMMTAGLNTR